MRRDQPVKRKDRCKSAFPPKNIQIWLRDAMIHGVSGQHHRSVEVRSRCAAAEVRRWPSHELRRERVFPSGVYFSKQASRLLCRGVPIITPTSNTTSCKK